MTKEQIFISYRRDGGDVIARLICESLKNMGYTVFYDYDSIQNGVFSDRITGAIKDCTDFVLVLSPHALDRCGNADDFVRREIRYALEHKKNIIPVFLEGFEFPQYLPEDIAQVRQYNGFYYYTAYHQAGIEKIAKMAYSRPGKVRRREPTPHRDKKPTAEKPRFPLLSMAKIGWALLLILSLALCFPEPKLICRIIAAGCGAAALGLGYYISRSGRKMWAHYGKTFWMVLAGVVLLVNAVALLGLIKAPEWQINGGTLKACYIDEAVIEVPDGVTEIGGFAFAGAWRTRGKNIQVIHLPDSVYTIRQSAFSGCDSLREVYIGAGVKYIESGAFQTCAHLTIYFDGAVEQWNQIDMAEGLFGWAMGLVDYQIVFLK
jgi:hypothetical protein